MIPQSHTLGIQRPPKDPLDPLIVIASNRGPFTFTEQPDETFAVERGAGGLVTALSALAQNHDVLWVAAALTPGDHLWAQSHNGTMQTVQDMKLQLIRPDSQRYEQYYNTISNPLLWFIQHQLWDTPRNPLITRSTWDAWENGYLAINQQFADTIAETVAGSERPVIIFPQDYHLYLLPHFLRQRLGDRVQIQPFIHIPWPGPDAWRMLPESMRTTLLTSLLMADRVGFQTQSDAFNFVQTCRFYVPNAHSHGSRNSIEYNGRVVEAKAYPISIEVDRVRELLEDSETRMFKSQIVNFADNRQLILRTDRIEPSKNILRGLLAYRTLLENHPEHQGQVQMLALLVPSRMEVDEYQNYLREIMAEAGMINADYGDGFWEPVRIIMGDNYRRALAALQLYDVLLVNPIADGMNLVAKEGALVNQHDGVLVLSEYAGVYYELGEHALVVSPFDIYSTAESLHQALTMITDERRQRSEAMRQLVEGGGTKQWFANQVQDALTAFSSQAKKASTPATPAASKSAVSSTAAGTPSDSTPKPSA
ncbi:MAG: trehalose-6-phosphate synthase [Anaerolineaceae bacterium]|nr:trehalose-6-phosphate synthase [Anaerolineaceae bacterium]